MEDIKIIKWNNKYKREFRDISKIWLEKYDLFEEKDKEILKDPEKHIINKGGMIFFSLYKEKVVGTSSIIKIDDNSFEIAKVGILEDYQGKGLSKPLIEECIKFACSNKAENIVLFTHQKLESAVGLYEKYGFNEVYLGESDYQTVDMKMKLDLEDNMCNI